MLQTLVQVDWEPGPTEIVHSWAGPDCKVRYREKVIEASPGLGY